MLPAARMSAILFVAACGAEAPPKALTPDPVTVREGAPCTSPSDCPPADGACVEPACVSGRCGVSPKLAGTLPNDDVRGDCKRPSCGDHGERVDRIDPGDVPPPSRSCVTVRCEEAGPVEDPAPGGPCGERGSCARDASCQTVERLVVGSRHGCTLMAGGAVRCFGWDEMGQLSGAAATRLARHGELVPFVQDAIDVAVNDSQSCALLRDGSVTCWGGRGDATFRFKQGKGGPVIARIEGLGATTAIAAAGHHACAIHSGGVLSCWGDASPKPVLIARPRRATANLVAGPNGVCSLFDDHTVQCFHTRWEVSPSGRSVMPEAEAMRGILSLSLGASHACAVVEGGAVSCWGVASNGEVNPEDGARNDFAPPSRIAGLTEAKAVATAMRQTCALLADGRTVCWGLPYQGEGRGRLRVVPWSRPARSLAMAYEFGCALGVDGQLLCLGDASFGVSSTRPYDATAPAWAVTF